MAIFILEGKLTPDKFNILILSEKEKKNYAIRYCYQKKKKD